VSKPRKGWLVRIAYRGQDGGLKWGEFAHSTAGAAGKVWSKLRDRAEVAELWKGLKLVAQVRKVPTAQVYDLDEYAKFQRAQVGDAFEEEEVPF